VKVLHVNNVDLPGRRFNGYDLLNDMRSRGVDSKQAVLWKTSQNPDVTTLLDGGRDDLLLTAIRKVEKRHGMHDLLFPWGKVLANTQEFQDADVVHYHLVHNDLISLPDLPYLFSLKPSVWTLHDPWAFTGHCIYPLDCEGWLDGCDPCPYLDRPFAMQVDGAGRMWRVKQQIYRELEVDLVVASQFMHGLLTRSPLTAHFEDVHLIPFGIHTEQFLPDDWRSASRKRLGIAEDDFVLFFRASEIEVKGLAELVKALELHPPTRPTTLLTVDETGLLTQLTSDYTIVERGWVEDESLYLLYSACDVFVMPSTAEAFGLMAIEAMAAGRPVVCFEGTSLPAVSHAPDCGIAVPMGDSVALREALDSLAESPEEVRRRGELGRALATKEYGYGCYLDALATLYRDVEARRR